MTKKILKIYIFSPKFKPWFLKMSPLIIGFYVLVAKYKWDTKLEKPRKYKTRHSVRKSFGSSTHSERHLFSPPVLWLRKTEAYPSVYLFIF